jgi:hypothetical protein
VKEVALIGEVVRECSGLSRMELARTVCELLRWRRPNGRLKARECREFLKRLDADGALVLPDKRQGRATGSVTRVPHTAAGEPGPPLVFAAFLVFPRVILHSRGRLALPTEKRPRQTGVWPREGLGSGQGPT